MLSKVLIAGGPSVGKTTLAKKLQASGLLGDINTYHTDDLIGLTTWSGVSEQVSTWFDRPGPWIIEGVAVPRALRKWLLANPTGKPADVVYWSSTAYIPLLGGKAAMTKGVLTVWKQIEEDLIERGVKIQRFPG